MAHPIPLAPHTLSLALQYLLPPSEFPTHLLAKSLLQRHHFLTISPSNPAAYLCWPGPTADPEQAIRALDRLATQDHEHLVQTAEIKYQPASTDADPVRARVWLGNSVQLVFVWEEDQDGAGWRYLDTDHRPIPAGCSPTLAPALQITPAAEQEHEQEPSPDDYWAGYDSGSSPASPRVPARTLAPSATEEEDAYWASYGTVHGSGDSTVPSPAPAKHKQLDAWGREELPWDEHAELDAQAWDARVEAPPRHGLGVTILSNSRPPTPPSLTTRPLSLSIQSQAPAPLPGLDHRNWNSPPSSLSAPFSAMSEPDDAPLDEEPASKAEEPAASSANTLSPADVGLSSAIKGMYALWKASNPTASPEEGRTAFLAVVGSALADA